jgi:hypothetical protein
MPFPTARYAKPYVGTTRGQRPSNCPRANSSLCSMFRGYLSPQRTVSHQYYSHVQCSHLCRFLTPYRPISTREETYSSHTRQCQVSSCLRSETVALQTSRVAHAAISTTLQSRSQSNRAGLETGPSVGHPQQILSDTGRSYRRRKGTICPMAMPQFSTASTMRHSLRRCVY